MNLVCRGLNVLWRCCKDRNITDFVVIMIGIQFISDNCDDDRYNNENYNDNNANNYYAIGYNE